MWVGGCEKGGEGAAAPKSTPGCGFLLPEGQEEEAVGRAFVPAKQPVDGSTRLPLDLLSLSLLQPPSFPLRQR